MKVFIVSVGIILMQLTALVFHSDLTAYNNSKYMLKMLAEECAAGSAVNADADAFNEGNIVFGEESRAYTDGLVAYANAYYPVFRDGTVYVESYDATDSAADLYVAVELCYTRDTDYFRLPLINVTQIIHASKYEYLQIDE